MDLFSNDSTISQVGRLHAGSYTCTAANGVGEPAVAQLALHVLYPPVLEAAGGGGGSGSGGSVSGGYGSGGAGSGGRILGGIGRRIELRCRIWAEPEPEVKWLKNGVQELVEIPGIRQVNKRSEAEFIDP
jgi:hypothetical protein